MSRPANINRELDRELSDLPDEMRWRTWMGRVEAVIFASPEPVPREILQELVGHRCDLDEVVKAIRSELEARPYEIVLVAGGYQYRTRKEYADAVRSVRVHADVGDLSEKEAAVLMAIAYFQPLTRAQLSDIFGKEISRNVIATLRGLELIEAGPRSPTPGAPYTYVTTRGFLVRFDFASLNDLPNLEALEDAGLFDKARLVKGGSLPVGADADGSGMDLWSE